jgi:predicted nucleic-acid-binding protein
VVLELEWVLRGYYKSPPEDVLTVLTHLLAMPNLDMEDRVAVELAAAALGDGFDFADALHHASSRHCTSLATFDDKKFARRASAKGWKPPVKLVAV